MYEVSVVLNLFRDPRCEWYGVGCETGDDNIVHVTYLDLNSNNLDGILPNKIGY